MIFTNPNASWTKDHVFNSLNKMALLSGNINTSLILKDPYFPKPTFLNFLGTYLWPMLFINPLSSPIINNNTPCFLLFSKHLDFTNFNSFGCLSYASTLQRNHTKFYSHSKNYVYLGNRGETKGYLFYDLTTNNFLVSKNLIFLWILFSYSYFPW